MKNIVVAVDFSDLTDEIMRMTSKLGKAFGSKVWLLHATQAGLESPYVVDNMATQDMFPAYNYSAIQYPFFDIYEVDRNKIAENIKQEHGRLMDLASQMKKEGVETTGIVAQGPAVEVIVKKCKRFEADLLIMGTHGHGFIHRTLLGSVSEGVLQKYHGPMLVVPAKGED